MSKYLESFLTHQNMTLFKSHYSKLKLPLNVALPSLVIWRMVWLFTSAETSMRLFCFRVSIDSTVRSHKLLSGLTWSSCTLSSVPFMKSLTCSTVVVIWNQRKHISVCTSNLDIISQLSLHQNISQTFSPMSDRTRLRRPLPPSRRRLLQHFSMGADSSFLACSKYIHPSI